MPARTLSMSGGFVFHILNRSVRGVRIFLDARNYNAFQKVLTEGLVRVPIRLLAYCVMPNHWHLVLWPQSDEMPRFMHWLTLTHAKRWHKAHGSGGTGPLYQNRYKAIAVQNGDHLLRVIRYVERNPVRAQLVDRAEQWPWSSLSRRRDDRNRIQIAEWPILRPENWLEIVNQPQTANELELIRTAVKLGRPVGDAEWCHSTARQLNLTQRVRGRPKKPGLIFRSEA